MSTVSKTFWRNTLGLFSLLARKFFLRFTPDWIRRPLLGPWPSSSSENFYSAGLHMGLRVGI